jgi:hypothetical protein
VRFDALVLLGAGAMSIDARIEAAINAALGQSGDADLALHHAQDRGASAPVHQLAIASAITAVATIAGLGFVSLLPRPSMVAAAPVFIQADQADRQAVEARFERMVEDIRLREIGFQRDADENDSLGSVFGAKVFPVPAAALRKSWGVK